MTIESSARQLETAFDLMTHFANTRRLALGYRSSFNSLTTERHSS
ncbi:putative metallophosphoesterase [Burkholderia thailandensis]|nr:putative metallophosphoesterase [Burkholderia thailandensis]